MLDIFNLEKDNRITIVRTIKINKYIAEELLSLFFCNNENRYKSMFYSDKSNIRTNFAYNKYLDNCWDPFCDDNLIPKSIIIFFKHDKYLSFYEGKHRMIALSKLTDSTKEYPFVCAIGWPDTLISFREKVKKYGNVHRYLLKDVIANNKERIKSGVDVEIDNEDIDRIWRTYVHN